MTMNALFSISEAPIEVGAIRGQLADPSCGAIVLFEGMVRNHHLGKGVVHLRYEHHPLMAEPTGQTIMHEVFQKFQITRAVAVHRVGLLQVGELAIVTAVAAAHRAEAFAACQYLVDEIKLRVPIWKYESYKDGTSSYTQQCEGCSRRGPRD